MRVTAAAASVVGKQAGRQTNCCEAILKFSHLNIPRFWCALLWPSHTNILALYFCPSLRPSSPLLLLKVASLLPVCCNSTKLCLQKCVCVCLCVQLSSTLLYSVCDSKLANNSINFIEETGDSAAAGALALSVALLFQC